MFSGNDPKSKARVLELKGDKALSKNKTRKALKYYDDALEYDLTRLELYDKIIDTHKLFQDEWDESDFAYNLAITMKKQEVEDPTFKRLHARHEPEYKEVAVLIKNLLDAKDSAEETQAVEKIREFDGDAVYPLIDAVLGFKEFGKIKKKEKS